MTVPATQRAAAQTLLSLFEIDRPQVGRYRDDDESHAIDILTAVDRPEAGLTTYSTLGLHLVENTLDGVNVPVELLGVAPTDLAWFPNLAATAAFYVIKNGWLVAPGVVFPNVVLEYDKTVSTPHLLWTTPFIWPELGSVSLGDGAKAHWLMAVPITDGERAMLHSSGIDELEALFEQRQVPYFDFKRASLI